MKKLLNVSARLVNVFGKDVYPGKALFLDDKVVGSFDHVCFEISDVKEADPNEDMSEIEKAERALLEAQRKGNAKAIATAKAKLAKLMKVEIEDPRDKE